MAEPETSDAKRITTVPLADGLIMPCIMAIFPAARELAFDVVGIL